MMAGRRISRLRLRTFLFLAAGLFTAAGAVSAIRLSAEREALFHTYRTGTWMVAEVQTEYLRTLLHAEIFRATPTKENLDRVKLQFDLFWSRIPLITNSQEAEGVRDIDIVRQTAAIIDFALPGLDEKLQGVRPGDANAMSSFIARLDAFDIPISNMAQKVLIQDQRLYQRTKLYSRLDMTFIIFAVALSTGLILIFIGLIQLRRIERLNDESLQAAQYLAARVRAIEASHDGIALISPDGYVEFANLSLAKLLGVLSPEAILGRFWTDVPSIGRTELNPDGVDSCTIEVAIARGTCDVQYWDMSITRRDDGGNVILVRDVTEKRNAQHQNEILREQFHRSQKMEAIGRLAGGIAHDFNNILAAVTGFAYLLKDDLQERSEQREFAIQITSAAERGKDLVQRILSFSRAESEKQTSVDLRELLRETVAMLQSALPDKGCFAANFSEELPLIRGNATQIAQVIMNLVVNSSDAIEGGKGSVNLDVAVVNIDGGCADGLKDTSRGDDGGTPIRIVQLSPTASKAWIGILRMPGEYIRICVSDTGCGIPYHVMERMFDPFFTTKGQSKGTGLGLASVIGIVKSHFGAISVDTTLGHGTTFHVYLPVQRDIAPALQDRSDGHATFILSGIRALIVDDDLPVGNVLQKIFERFDCDAVLCGDSTAAKSALEEEPTAFDLIITDMTMPGINGFDLAVSARAAGFRGPIILTTGRSEMVTERMLQNAGIDALLPKPFRLTDVACQVQAALSTRAAVDSY